MPVVTGQANYPSMHLHWLLSGPGVASASDEHVTDLNYTRGLHRREEYTSLYYDRRMLTDWFRQRFANGRAD